jgi:Cdc6-like AAA superfamily ATPase
MEPLEVAHMVQIILQQNRNKRKRESREIPNHMLSPVPYDLVPTTLKGLIRLARFCSSTVLYRDCQKLGSLLEPLEACDALVGLQDIKQCILNFVISKLQSDIHLPSMAHIAITGPPGTGKTTLVDVLAKIVATIYNSAHPRIVHFRTETAIGQYLGQTGPKTQALIESSFGGVLAIDEVTSLSDGRSNGDSFSKTAIDVLNRMLSEKGNKFTCIIAGYGDDIERDFFAVNKGLKRRFGQTWVVHSYTAHEMCLIASAYLEKSKFQVCEPLSEDLFRSGFPYNAGSVVACMDIVISVHVLSVFGQDEKRIIQSSSVKKGFETYKSSHVSSQENFSMYL